MKADFLLNLGLDEEQTYKVIEEHERIMDEVRFDTALNEAVASTKPRNVNAVKALLDMSLLSFEDGKILGLDEQLVKIKAEHDYLFETQLASGAGFSEPAPKNDAEANKINIAFGFVN